MLYVILLVRTTFLVCRVKMYVCAIRFNETQQRSQKLIQFCTRYAISQYNNNNIMLAKCLNYSKYLRVNFINRKLLKIFHKVIFFSAPLLYLINFTNVTFLFNIIDWYKRMCTSLIYILRLRLLVFHYDIFCIYTCKYIFFK